MLSRGISCRRAARASSLEEHSSVVRHNVLGVRSCPCLAIKRLLEMYRLCFRRDLFGSAFSWWRPSFCLFRNTAPSSCPCLAMKRALETYRLCFRRGLFGSVFSWWWPSFCLFRNTAPSGARFHDCRSNLSRWRCRANQPVP